MKHPKRFLFVLALLLPCLAFGSLTPWLRFFKTPAQAMIINPYAFPAGGGGATFAAITSRSSGTLRNDFTASLGFYFKVGASPITVTSLGRWVVSGNSASHTVEIFDMASTSLVSTSINTSGKPAGAFAYNSCTPTVLAANTEYFCVSSEVSSGDQWYDYDETAAYSTDFSASTSAYIISGSLNYDLGHPGRAPWVTPNFLYTF